ncbi:N-acylneuraminate-9-phosphatase isoform X2 [Rhinatrema bivittatum]|uniref:N-acylneuraminate-9-phosphatase isoform X2 n=1 Tax=Rhinatrema bivittatum TaxID=194408 RepID=UPI001128DCAF|nr:N-acylneuraminate-9-phosphatase isoform X2 [Rhinatrema bivittatum]
MPILLHLYKQRQTHTIPPLSFSHALHSLRHTNPHCSLTYLYDTLSTRFGCLRAGVGSPVLGTHLTRQVFGISTNEYVYERVQWRQSMQIYLLHIYFGSLENLTWNQKKAVLGSFFFYPKHFNITSLHLKMVLSGVKAVFFDLDNTLIDTAGASKKAIQEVINVLRYKHHYSKEDAIATCDHFQTKLLQESCDPASQMSIDELRVLHWEEAIQETRNTEPNRSLATECYSLWKSTRLDHMTLGEATRDLLTNLRKATRLLLLTNGERQVQREKIEACACQPYFDAIVVGGEHEEEKPALSIFQHCCSILGVRPEDCIMVGDNLDTDILGGLNAGLKATVWINKNMSMVKSPSPVPHYTIPSVLDLPAVLTSIDHKDSECRHSLND